jgi:hypothetical protein
MSRSLSFELIVAQVRVSAPLLRIKTRADYPAEQLAPTVPAKSLRPALEAYAAIDQMPPPPPVEVAGRHELVFRLTPQVAGSVWRMATLVNLIDNAVFGTDDPDRSNLVESVTFEAETPGFETVDELHAALEERKEQCRQEMTLVLPIGFETHPDIGREWPADGIEWLFSLNLALSRDLSDAEQSEAHQLLDGIDSMLAWTAFETRKSPIEILQAAIVPYPSELTVQSDVVHYSLEMPPSGIALPLVMMKDVLSNRFSAKISSWDIGIEEGW